VISRDPAKSPINPSADYQAPKTRAASDLVKLAREAFEEKRLQNCLTLTASILKIEPENKDAQVIQMWVAADMDREFQLASKLANEARVQPNRGKWATIQISLRRILNILPEHEGAKILLAEALSILETPDAAGEKFSKAKPQFTPTQQTRPKQVYRKKKSAAMGRFVAILLLICAVGTGYVAVRKFHLPVMETLRSLSAALSADSGSQGQLVLQIDDGLQVFVDGQYRGTSPFQPFMLPVGKHQLSYKSGGLVVAQEEIEIVSNRPTANTTGKGLGRLDFLIVPTTGVQLAIDGAEVGQAPSTVILKPGTHRLAFKADGRLSEVRNVDVGAGERKLVPVLLREGGQPDDRAEQQKTAPPQVPNPSAANPPPVKNPSGTGPSDAKARPPANPAGPRRGKLAISSPMRAQIYLDGRMIGATPTTLDLPAGEQTLEYRYEDLRKRITHTVRPDETTAVNVVMDITLQINAQPWAEVFLQDGTSLGQTPLSGIRVPVGSLLIFRNPGFSEKTYRVSSRDTSVGVVFQ
jgi:hypothetical protein